MVTDKARETLLKHMGNNNNNRAARGKMGHQSIAG
jgi:hypothetical protein